jgi:hypothetical protein
MVTEMACATTTTHAPAIPVTPAVQLKAGILTTMVYVITQTPVPMTQATAARSVAIQMEMDSAINQIHVRATILTHAARLMAATLTTTASATTTIHAQVM